MPVEILNMLVDVAFFLAALAVVLLVYVGYRLGTEYVRSAVGAAKYDYFRGKVEEIVRALEQQGLILKFDGPTKKRLAKVALVKVRDYLKLDMVSDKDIDQMIEAMVQILNTEQGKFVPVVELSGENFQPEV